MTFQERLITLRKQQGLSQEQLGYELGVTRQTVSKWELGVTTPEMDKLNGFQSAGNRLRTDSPGNSLCSLPLAL